MQPARQSAFNKAKVKGRQLQCGCIIYLFFFLSSSAYFSPYDTGRANTNKKIAAKRAIRKISRWEQFPHGVLASSGSFNLNAGGNKPLVHVGDVINSIGVPELEPFDLVPANKCGNEWSPYMLPAGAHLALLTSPSAAIQIHAGVAEAASEFFRAVTDGASGALFAHTPVSAGVWSARRPPPLARRACKIDTQSQTEYTAITRGQG